MLALSLPAGAQTWVAAGWDNAWTTGDYLAAHAVDALMGANWQRSGDAKAAKPKPIPRPKDAREERSWTARNAARARAFRDRNRRREEGS